MPWLIHSLAVHSDRADDGEHPHRAGKLNRLMKAQISLQNKNGVKERKKCLVCLQAKSALARWTSCRRLRSSRPCDALIRGQQLMMCTHTAHRSPVVGARRAAQQEKNDHARARKRKMLISAAQSENSDLLTDNCAITSLQHAHPRLVAVAVCARVQNAFSPLPDFDLFMAVRGNADFHCG